MYRNMNTAVSMSDDGKTAIFITKDEDFIQHIEKARLGYLCDTAYLGTVGAFTIYSCSASGNDFSYLVLVTQGIDY